MATLDRPIRALAADVRTGRLKAEALAEAAIDAHGRRGESLAAYKHWDPDAALNASRAVDAAVAAQLCACVSEPLLTGLGGGGLAMVHMGGKSLTCDFFSDAPGVHGKMTSVEVDFGPTTQVFHVGPGSVTVPGLPAGLWAMHQRWGQVPMRELVQPALDAARDGVVVSSGFARVAELLWPILRLSPASAALFGREGRALGKGELFLNAALGDTLQAYVRQGPDLFRTGHVANLLLQAAPHLTHADLVGYQPAFREALAIPYRKTTAYLPAEPSQGGFQVARALLELGQGPMPSPLGFDHVERLALAMDHAQREGGLMAESLYQPGFRERYLGLLAKVSPTGSGFTTHVSTVDSEGNAVAITSSLGETAGLVLGDTGVCPNNFLGEEDVNPPGHEAPAGRRLVTMCCPTVLTGGCRVFAFGSGGSSRIRSAVLHAVVYLVDHGIAPERVPGLPRCHMQDGVLHVESFDRPDHTLEELRDEHPRLVVFERPEMYFGGLHIAGLVPRGFVGGGDPRRSGDFAVFSG